MEVIRKCCGYLRVPPLLRLWRHLVQVRPAPQQRHLARQVRQLCQQVLLVWLFLPPLWPFWLLLPALFLATKLPLPNENWVETSIII